MLRFHARPGHVCPRPGTTFAGQLARYVGRTTKIERDAAGVTVAIKHPAVEAPFECEEDSQDGKRLLRLMRVDRASYPLWPADAETASRCGVPFVEVELSDGEWLPKASAKADSPKKGSDK
jgi:hypothetical protein